MTSIATAKRNKQLSQSGVFMHKLILLDELSCQGVNL
jgi:hypothetical protein